MCPCVCVSLCLSICLSICLSASLSLFIYIYNYMHTYMHLYMYTCNYIHIHNILLLLNSLKMVIQSQCSLMTLIHYTIHQSPYNGKVSLKSLLQYVYALLCVRWICTKRCSSSSCSKKQISRIYNSWCGSFSWNFINYFLLCL